MPESAHKKEAIANKAPTKHSSDFDFGAQMVELESIAQYLQGSDVDIDQAIAKYERGVKIAKDLQAYLKTAENKVRSLKQNFDKD